MSISDSGKYDLLNQLAEEFAARFRRGERGVLKEYTDSYPELAEEIRELFPAMVRVEQVKGAQQGEEKKESGDSRAANPRLRQLGDYRILREVGRGGMGVVYEAEQISLGRRVALKVLPGQVSSDRLVQERFRREARAAARLHHTNIVPVYDVGRVGDVRFYAMQFIEGLGLDAVVTELQRLRDRAESEGKLGASALDSLSLQPGGEHSGQGVEAPTLGEGVEVSAVLQYILTGRLDPGGRCPEPAEALEPSLAMAYGGGLGTPTGTGTESRAAEFDPALTRTENGSVTAGDTNGPQRAHPQAPALSQSASPSSTSAILPGGAQLSSVESGRRGFIRGLAQIGQQVAGGLAYAHARGIVHRDIKPSNLLLDTEGVVWITDFGLAKGEDEGLTHTGDILGTLRYMAPERFRGEGDARADVYALGLTLYELLTLRPGFESSDRLKLIEQIKTEEPLRPRAFDARIPRDLETILLKAIEKDPKARYQTAEAMAEDLRRFLADEPIRARQVSASERYWRWARRNPVIAVMGGVLTAVLIAVTVASLLAAGRFASLAERQGNSASAERSARLEANQDRKAAEKARADAQAETYRAMLSEVKALRAGRQPGWRDEALAELSRLAVMPTPRRDLVELRTEAVATLGTPDIRLVTRIELPSDHLRSIAFSPDARTLVTASNKTGLDFWDVRGQRHLSSVEGLGVTELPWRFNKAVYLARDQGLAVATQDHGVVFTDGRGIRTPQVPITRGASKPITLAIGAKGQRIAVEWTDGGGITVHDSANGTLLQRFDGFEDSPFTISPDGQWLARQESADVVLHPIGSGEPKVVLALGQHNRFRTFAFSPDGAMLAGACYDHTTVLWDVARRKQFNTLRGHRQRVINVAFSPDGEWIATTSGDYTTRIWETRTGQTLATLPGFGDMAQVVWSPDGNYLAVITYWWSKVFLYRVTGRHDVQQWLTGLGAEAVAAAPHPRLEQFTTVFANGELLTWDVSVPRPEHRRIGTEPGQGTSLAYSPDGTLLATGSWSGATARTILVRDVRSSEIRCKIQCSDIPSALVFDESRQRLASGDLSGKLVIWNLATNLPMRQFATGSAIRSIAFLDGDRRLVTHDKGAVLLYNLQSGRVERRATLQGDIRRFVVDRERSRLVVAFESGAIASLSLPGLSPGHRLENAHHGPVECLALSPDGRLLADGGADHRVVLRDPLTFEPLLNFPEWTRTLRDMAFDCTSRRLATVGTDSDLDLWDIAALNDGLTDVDLAWGRPAPATAPTDSRSGGRASPTPGITVVRP